MPNEINDISDIDAMLDKEFHLDDVEDTDNVESGEEETSEETNNDISEETSDESTETNEDSEGENKGQDDIKDQNKETSNVGKSKLNLDDKKDYAFVQLRRENSDLKAKLNSSSENDTFLKKLAAQYGYNDVKQFEKAYEDARIAKEAKDKGYDVELYRQLQESNRRIEQLEKQNNENLLRQRASDFKNALDKVVSEYSLGDAGRNEVFTRLEQAGYTIDELLKYQNPEFLIRGIMMDKILDYSKQAQIEKAKDIEDNLSDERHDGQAQDKAFSLDDLIKSEMQEYKKELYY